MPAFKTQFDIANVGARILGVPQITSFTGSKYAVEVGASYDQIREGALRRDVWTKSTRRVVLRPTDITTLVWTPPAFDDTATYALGNVVTDTTGDWWQSKVAGNSANPPGVGAFWRRYCGPDSMDPFVPQAVTSPSAPNSTALGSSVSGALGAATYFVKITYVTATGETVPSPEASLAVASNSVLTVASPPAATGATGWNVYINTVQGWETLQNASPIAIGTPFTEPTSGLVTGHFPPSTNQTTYRAGELTHYNGVFYLSLRDFNNDTPPSQSWLVISGTGVLQQIIYPLSCGPRVDASSQNVFRLPFGYLRNCPQDPKGGMGIFAQVGGPVGPDQKDWIFEGGFIVSWDSTPIMFRFVCNDSDVPNFDPMLCEAIGSRLAWELCERITQSAEKKADAAGHYKWAVAEARAVNGIEVGTVSPPIDDWIIVRH